MLFCHDQCQGNSCSKSQTSNVAPVVRLLPADNVPHWNQMSRFVQAQRNRTMVQHQRTVRAGVVGRRARWRSVSRGAGAGKGPLPVSSAGSWSLVFDTPVCSLAAPQIGTIDCM